MTSNSKLNVLTFAALLAASLGSVAIAQNTPVDPEMGMDGMGMDHGGPRDGMFLNFDEIDADKDGKITAAELEAHRAARFAAADANKDGSLSAEELVAMHEAARAERQLARSTDMIARFDANGDGLLSADEMPQPGEGKGMFDRIDTDKDGAISKAEADAAKEQMREGRGHGKGHGKGHGHGMGHWFGMGGDDN
jgi:Ca2+-binding EF-hand superfamily protein